MSEEQPVYQEGETVPVPDKGGWIDGETGQVLPVPPPDVGTPVKAPQPGVVQPIRQPGKGAEPEQRPAVLPNRDAPKAPEPKKAS